MYYYCFKFVVTEPLLVSLVTVTVHVV